MSLRSIPLLLATAALLLATSCNGQQNNAYWQDDAIQRVEEGLVPALRAEDAADQNATIAERMAFYGIPGVSIAVIDGGELVWARGYGVTDAGGEERVTEETLFQAASISKPVAALGALLLVQEGRLHLDEDVNTWLTSWKIPPNAFTEEMPVTLRGLLSHTAGLTVHGFPGYAAGDALPALAQVLDGAPPANTAPIRVDTPPGSQWRYSGGGYTVLQQLLVDVAEQPFPDFMARSVLQPLGMRHSTFAQPLPDTLRTQATSAHLAGGEPVEGRYHHYPEMAAAGLWTTPSDLARFAIGIQQAANGSPDALLNTTLAHEMLSRQLESFGLGPALEGSGETARFSHGGTNHGFNGNMVAYVEQGQGAVVMTNASMGHALINEILDSIAREYDWADYPQIQPRTYVPMDAADIEPLVGRYALGPNAHVRLVRDGARLFAEMPGQGLIEIYHAGSGVYFSPGIGVEELRFVEDERGRITEMRIGPEDAAQRLERVP